MTGDQFAALMAVLTDIRNVLYVGIEASEEEEPGDECTHPDENRVSLATLSDPDHWICSVCRFEHKGLIRN